MAISSSNDLNLHRAVGRIQPFTYVRPSEWPNIENDIGPTEHKIVGLFQVNNTASEFCSLVVNTGNSSTYTVDWGDGSSPTVHGSGTTASKTYSYSSGGLTSTSYGYKIAKVTVTSTSGVATITSFQIGRHASQTGSIVMVPWLDIDMYLPSATTLTLANSGNYQNAAQKIRIRSSALTSYASKFVGCNQLIIAEINSTATVTNASSMFSGCVSLQVVAGTLNLSSVTNTSSMFSGCVSLKFIPAVMNLSSCTNASSMFAGCASLKNVPDVLDFSLITSALALFSGCNSLEKVPATLNFSSSKNMQNVFLNCYSLRVIPSLTVTSAVTAYSGCFSGCRALEYIPSLDLTNVTTVAGIFTGCYSVKSIGAMVKASSSTVLNAGSTLTSCESLQEMPSNWHFYAASGTLSFSTCYSMSSYSNATWGTFFNINITDNRLDAAALDALYTSLPTVTSKTITVTGNPGTSGDTPSIATAKGWAVTG